MAADIAVGACLRIQRNVEGSSRRPWFDLRKRFRMYDAARNGRVGRAQLNMVLEHFRVSLEDHEAKAIGTLWGVGGLGDIDFSKFVQDLERDPRELPSRIAQLQRDNLALEHERRVSKPHTTTPQQVPVYAAGPYSQDTRLAYGSGNPPQGSPSNGYGPGSGPGPGLGPGPGPDGYANGEWQQKSERLKTPTGHQPMADDISNQLRDMDVRDSDGSAKRSSRKKGSSGGGRGDNSDISGSKGPQRKSSTGRSDRHKDRVRSNASRRRDSADGRTSGGGSASGSKSTRSHTTKAAGGQSKVKRPPLPGRGGPAGPKKPPRPKSATHTKHGIPICKLGSNISESSKAQQTRFSKKAMTKGVTATSLSSLQGPQMVECTPAMENPKKKKSKGGYDMFSN